LIVSLCLNLGLVAAWGVLSQRKQRAPEYPEVKAAPANTTESRSARSLTEGTVITNLIKTDFTWNRLETKDFKKYIANLRNIGCPELTVQDIILAELDYIYEPQLNALKGLNVPVQPQQFWRESTPSPKPQRAANADKEIKRLEDERRELVRELLGKEEKPLRTANNYFEDTAQSRHAFLSPENVERMHQLESKYEKLGGAMAKETGYKNEEARQKMLAEMRTFMTSEEVFEYEIRTSNLTKQLRNSLKGAAPTEQEFRAIFTANYEAYLLNASGKAEAQEVQVAKQKATDTLQATLGEERYTEMQRSQDFGYRQLMAASSFLGYDRAAALRVYGMRTDVQRAVQAVQANTTLSPEARTKAVEEIRLAAEKTIQAELGASGAKHYLKSGGSWLRGLATERVQYFTR